MKLTALLLTVICICTSVFTSSLITFSAKKVTLDKVFGAIGKQTDYHSLYNLSDQKYAKKVNSNMINVSVEDVRNKSTGGQLFDCKRDDKYVFVVINKSNGRQLLDYNRSDKSVFIVSKEMAGPGYCIDNIPFGGEMNNINPNDIRSITVLRDAAATSIWGSNEGNSAIVITTKKGKTNQMGKVRFTYNVAITKNTGLFNCLLITLFENMNLAHFLLKKRYTGIKLNPLLAHPLNNLLFKTNS